MIGKSRSSGRYSAAVAKEIKESALNVSPRPAKGATFKRKSSIENLPLVSGAANN